MTPLVSPSARGFAHLPSTVVRISYPTKAMIFLAQKKKEDLFGFFGVYVLWFIPAIYIVVSGHKWKVLLIF